MSKNKYYLAVGLVSLMVTTAAVASITSANWGCDDGMGRHKEASSLMSERRGIIESNDYSAWQEMMNKKADLFDEKASKIRALITEENFNNFMKIHELKMDGNFEEAKALWEEMGLGENGMMGQRFHRGEFKK